MPNLAYLTLCRSIQLLMLAARGDATKDLELLVLRHQLSVLGRHVPRPKLEPTDRAMLATLSRSLPRGRWSTVRAKCLDWLLFVGRRHLEQVLRVYTEH
jgi:hypothetical protein